MVSEFQDPDVALAGARVDAAVAARRGRRRERDLLMGDAHFVDILAGLAASSAPVVVSTVSGSRLQGSIVAVGPDVAVVSIPSHQVAVRIRAISSVEQPGGPATAGDASSVADIHLVDLLWELADGSTTVGVVPDGGQRIDGTIRSIGEDVVVLGPAERPGPTIYVALDSLNELWSPSVSA